jgi:subtilisin family serine protease
MHINLRTRRFGHPTARIARRFRAARRQAAGRRARLHAAEALEPRLALSINTVGISALESLSGMSLDTLEWDGQEVAAQVDRWVVHTLDAAADAAFAGHAGGGGNLDGLFGDFDDSWQVSSLGSGFFSLETPGVGREAVLDWAGGHASMFSVEPDIVIAPSFTTNDPLMYRTWGLHNYGQSGGTIDADIDAPEAWNTTTGSSSVVVGVIDTGIDYTHVDLVDNIWTNPGEIPGNGIDDDGNGYVDDYYGWDFYNNDSDPFDGHGHGTHVAGTIGATGNNGTGVAGVNHDVSLMALKFLNDNGWGSTSGAISAINYATMMKNLYGVNIVATNNSWGGGGYSSLLRAAIELSGDSDITFVAAAGNNGTNNDLTARYPTNYDLPNVISVAATDRNDNLASFSNYGATTVDLAAPGVSVYSTVTGNSYAYYSGTSMAAPHVTGVVALLHAANPGMIVADVRSAILGSVDSVAGLAGKTATGGRLNAAAALSMIDNAAPSLDPIDDLSIGHDATTEVILSATDPDGDVVSFTATLLGASQAATLSVAGNTLTVDPAAGFAGNFTVRVTASDGTNTSSPEEFVVTVAGTDASLPFADDFARADGTGIGANWSETAGDFVLVSSAAVSAASQASVALVNGVSSADVSVTAEVDVAAGISVGLAARATGAGDSSMYLGAIIGSGPNAVGTIWRNLGDGWTLLSLAQAGGSAGTLEFTVVGSSLSLSLDERVITAVTDTMITAAGSVGLRFWGAGSLAESFAASEIAAPEPEPASLPFAENFSMGDGTFVPGTFTESAGDFRIASGRAVSNARHASVMTLNGVAATDVTVSARVDVAGGVSAGLAARASGNGDADMYLGAILGSGSNAVATIWRNVGGQWTLLSITAAGKSAGLMEFTVEGSSLSLSLDGKLLTTTTDSAITGPGTVGLRYWGIGSTADDFTANELTPVTPEPASLPFADDFESTSGGSLPATFGITAGGFRTSGGRVISEGSKASVATLNDAAAADVRLTATVDVAQGISAGLAARHSGDGDSDMYLGAIVGRGANAVGTIWRNVGGQWTLLASGAAGGSAGLLEFTVVGSSLSLSFNGSVVATASDTAITGAGGVGLRQWGAGVAVDDFAAEEVSDPAMARMLAFAAIEAESSIPLRGTAHTLRR